MSRALRQIRRKDGGGTGANRPNDYPERITDLNRIASGDADDFRRINAQKREDEARLSRKEKSKE